MPNKKISELVKVTSSNATDEYVLSRGVTNVSIQSQYISALSASYALTASYAVSSSVEIKQEITSSYAETASYAYSTTILSGSASDARNELVTKISGSSIAPISSLSASLTVTDQTISSSVAILSGSASDARNLIVADNLALSASLTLTNQAISSSVATLSSSAASALTVYSASSSTYLTAYSSSAASDLTIYSSSAATYLTAYSASAATYLSSSISIANVLTSSFSETSSFSNTSSYSLTSISASHSLTASYAISSSHEITHEISSSYAETASYALNGGGGGSSAFPSEYIIADTNAEKGKTYVFDQPTAYTLTLPLSPTDGDSIQISNRSNITGNILDRNGESIMGSANDLILDLNTASFILTYTSGTQGWVIIGAVSGTTTGSAESIWYDGGTFLSSSADVRITGSMSVNGSIEYSNVYSTVNDLPSATQYHGMFAHVHSNGQAYFSHAGQWVKLATTYSSTYITTDTTAEENKVYVFEQSTPYTLTLPLSPSDGDSIYISNRSNITTNSVNGNGEKIMGDTQNLNLDISAAAFRLMYTTGNQGWVVLGADGSSVTTGSIGYNMLDDSFKTRASNVTLSSGTTSAIIDFDSSAIFEITTPTDTTATTLNFDNAKIGMSKMVLIVNQGTEGSGTITLGQTIGTGTFIRSSSDDIVRTVSTTNYLQITCIEESGDDRTFVYTVGTAQ